jgi:hypothetical protein
MVKMQLQSALLLVVPVRGIVIFQRRKLGTNHLLFRLGEVEDLDEFDSGERPT